MGLPSLASVPEHIHHICDELCIASSITYVMQLRTGPFNTFDNIKQPASGQETT